MVAEPQSPPNETVVTREVLPVLMWPSDMSRPNSTLPDTVLPLPMSVLDFQPMREAPSDIDRFESWTLMRGLSEP